MNNGNVLIVNNGIGYEVACSSACFKSLAIGKESEIYTYMAGREDGVYLYGFISPEEKNMFLKYHIQPYYDFLNYFKINKIQ